MGRQLALLLAVLTLATVGCDGPAPPREGTTPEAPSASHARRFDPPEGQRWAGLHHVVVAVPADWRSIETPFCQAPPTHTVVYFDRLNIAAACPYMGGRGPQRIPSYLDIQPLDRVTRQDLSGTHAIDLDGVTAYAWNHPHAEYAQSAGVLVPTQHVAFYVHTPDEKLAGHIIRSARAVPPGFQVIPKPAYANRHLDDMIQRLSARGLRPRYVEEPPGRSVYGYPGRFIRTDPPIGSAVKRGARVTAYFSSGRLSSWITDRRLASQGWSVRPPATFTPPVTRAQALAELDRGPIERAAFLRTLTVGHRMRQTWLVVVQPHYAYPGQAVTLAGVDAHTGRVWVAPTFFPATG